MKNLFNLFKKKEPPRQGGAIDAMNELSNAMQTFVDNFLYGAPVNTKPVQKNMALPKSIYIRYFSAVKNFPTIILI